MPCSVSCDKYESHFDNGHTNFTCQELIGYCNDYTSWTKTENSIKTVVNLGLLVSGFVGIISYIIMCIVFALPYFKGASFIYHKSIAYMELVHMIIMFQVRVDSSTLHSAADCAHLRRV
jgi:hypothetical protein